MKKSTSIETDIEHVIDSLTISNFRKTVYKTLIKIPAGTVITYKQLAELSGYPGSSRAVGTAMRTNPYPVTIPCHRVVKVSGELGRYSGPPGVTKKGLLSAEGITFDTHNRVLKTYYFSE